MQQHVLLRAQHTQACTAQDWGQIQSVFMAEKCVIIRLTVGLFLIFKTPDTSIFNIFELSSGIKGSLRVRDHA